MPGSSTLHHATIPPRRQDTIQRCPDGSVALAQCEDRTFRFQSFPTGTLGVSEATLPEAVTQQQLTQPSPILDYAWYPSATVRDPASFCFVASVRECPVKLLDASDGRLRASYRIVDHRERQVAPHSVAFNVGANRLYCGFEDAIEVFDVHRPGEGTRLRTTPSKKSRDGLKGIISALAFAPDVSSDLYAAGSFSPSAPTSSNIALFSEASGEVPVMFVGAEGHHGGAGYGVRASVSQLLFNPARPYLLYASFRRMEPIYCWDLRGDLGRPSAIYTTATPRIGGKARATATNQRLRFDIDYSGTWLAVGDEDGGISVFDLAAHAETLPGENTPQSESTQFNAPILQFEGHRDAVGSVAFHPLRPLLLSVSGSRHFDCSKLPLGSSSESESCASDSEDENSTVETCERSENERKSEEVRRSRARAQPVAVDASTKLWGFGHSIGDDQEE
ncbi:WD40-repeat-containing domain protein [Daedaleopsis nitida]|nr:WD40-repeat-containing domain protein [Daedaleopsis nitida]